MSMQGLNKLLFVILASLFVFSLIGSVIQGAMNNVAKEIVRNVER